MITGAIHSENRVCVETQATKLRQCMGSLIDSYAEGLIEKSEFQPRIERSKERLAKLEEQLRTLTEQAAQQQELRFVIRRLEEFSAGVKDELARADWSRKRELIQTLVKRVEIGSEQVNIMFRVEPGPSSPRGEPDSLPDCGRREAGGVCLDLTIFPSHRLSICHRLNATWYEQPLLSARSWRQRIASPRLLGLVPVDLARGPGSF